jgi:Beta-ketoacyl synthase, N-terminal domain
VKVFVGALALLAPGLEGWAAAREVLAGRRPYIAAPLVPPPPQSLPPAERRRTTATIRLAMAAAEASIAAAGAEAGRLASVFASSNGDGAVVGSILEALAGPTRVVSPTQFHNSVHNSPAAYWGIGSRSMGASTSFGCHDDTFAAGLLHAAAKAREAPVLFCAYDLPMPAPLAQVRQTAEPFAMAMVLTPSKAPWSVASLEVSFAAGEVPGSESPLPLQHANPIARSLPLLEALAREERATVHLPYLADSHLRIETTPCSTAPASPA